MLARFVLGAVTAGAVIAPALAGQMMNADEARRFVAGKVFAFTCFDGTRGAGRMLRGWRRGGRGAILRLRSGAPHAPSRQYAPGPRPVRLRLDQGASVRAVLQPRQAGRAQLPRIGLGHGFRLLRFPSSGRRADADGASGRPAAFAASAGSGPARWKYPRRVSRPRNSRDTGSSRSNPRRDRSFRNRKALRSCAARPTDRRPRFAGLNQP